MRQVSSFLDYCDTNCGNQVKDIASSQGNETFTPRCCLAQMLYKLYLSAALKY